MGVPRGVRKAMGAGRRGKRHRPPPPHRSGLGSARETAEKTGMDTSPPAARADRIRRALDTAFAAARIEVTDDSHRHAGHAGAAPGGETHYSVVVITPEFAGLGRLARSRRVHDLLAGEFAGGLHALSLRLLTPDEA